MAEPLQASIKLSSETSTNKIKVLLEREAIDIIVSKWELSDGTPILQLLESSDRGTVPELIVVASQSNPDEKLLDLELFHYVESPQECRQILVSMQAERCNRFQLRLAEFPITSAITESIREVFSFYTEHDIILHKPSNKIRSPYPGMIRVCLPINIFQSKGWAHLSFDRRFIDYLGVQIYQQSLISNDESLVNDMAQALCRQLVDHMSRRCNHALTWERPFSFGVVEKHRDTFLPPEGYELVGFDFQLGQRFGRFELTAETSWLLHHGQELPV